MSRARRVYSGTKEMKANITFDEISNELYNIFSDDRRAAAYMADGLGPQYIGLCGWAGAMSPANRAAFVATFGRDMTSRAEDQARARVAEYRAAVESSTYHAAELEADAWQAAYGTPKKSQAPEVGAFVWGRWSCLKGECGPLGELEELEYMDATGREIRRRLCEVVAVVDADPSEFMNRDFANGVARQFQQLGGSRWEESDPLRLDGEPMTWELVFCVRCAGRWYLIDGQGYEYTCYFLMPDEYRRMYAAELATITAAREQREADERAEAQRQADARRADYLARCARWSSLMEDVRPLVEAERAAYGNGEKSQIRKVSAKLSAARRRNLVAMASALYPGVKFSAKKWDGWGGSYELTWTDGPTEEHLQEAGDFDLFETTRDTFCGWDDSSDVVCAEFSEFAEQFFALGGQIRFSREVSDEFRHSIADRICEAVPGLPEDDRARIYDNAQQSAICGMFRDVEGVGLSYLCDHLERGGLRDVADYLARCMDTTPARQDEPTDPNGGGSPAPSYGDDEKSQLQDAPTVEGVEVVGYSEKALAVFGDTRALADELKAIGAKFNRALSYNGERRAGWIISRKKADELTAVLAVQGQETAPSTPADGWEQYNGVSWNPADLTGCKQAARILMRQEATFADLSALDFGNLDLFAVWEEEHPDAVAELDRWADIPEDEEHPEEEPTDPDTPDGDGEPSRPRYRHRYLPGTEPAAPALPEPPAAVVYDPAQPIESAPFHAVDAEGLAYGEAEKSQIKETMRAEAQREEICDWYCYEYPTDEEGAKIRAGVTFADIMAHPEKIYNYIPGDSIIRERVFRETANRYGVEYSEIYSRWLDGGEDSPTLPYGEPEKSPVPDHLADIYQQAKAKSAEAVALFHCGDWFTAYGEDADRVADAVGLIITTTRDGFRKASFPFPALDTYLPRMVRQGMKVCICEAPRQAEPSRREKVAQEV